MKWTGHVLAVDVAFLLPVSADEVDCGSSARPLTDSLTCRGRRTLVGGFPSCRWNLHVRRDPLPSSTSQSYICPIAVARAGGHAIVSRSRCMKLACYRSACGRCNGYGQSPVACHRIESVEPGRQFFASCASVPRSTNPSCSCEGLVMDSGHVFVIKGAIGEVVADASIISTDAVFSVRDY